MQQNINIAVIGSDSVKQQLLVNIIRKALKDHEVSVTYVPDPKSIVDDTNMLDILTRHKNDMNASIQLIQTARA